MQHLLYRGEHRRRSGCLGASFSSGFARFMYDPYRGCARHIPQVLRDGVLLVTAVPEQGDAEVFSVEGLPCGVIPPRHDHEP